MASEIAARQDRDQTGLAILLVTAAAVIVPISDGVAKQLTAALPILQVAFLRYVSQSLLLAPIVIHRFGSDAFRSKQPGVQLARSVLVLGATLFLYIALRNLPLADAVAIFFFNPFFVTALSPLVLGERVGIWRWSAVAAGLIGTLVVIRPGFEEIGVGTLAALASGACFGTFVLLTRRMRGKDPALVTSFLTGLMCAAGLSVAMPFVWATMSADLWPLVVALGIFGTGFSLTLIRAYELGDASMLAPFSYIEIIAAAVVGYIMFSDIPDAMTWIGIAIIIAAGVTITIRERVRQVRPTSPARVQR